jgi:hypothetical protein
MEQEANADAIRMIREAGADDAVLTIKSLEAFQKAADGRATKIIITSEIQGIAGLAASLKGIAEGSAAGSSAADASNASQGNLKVGTPKTLA